jgi:hypothetical protein
MTRKKDTSRRGAMRGFLAGFLLMLTPGTAPVTAGRDLRPALRSLFSQLPSARAIGAAYLREHPADAEMLAADFPTAPSAADLRSTVAARIRDDFAASRMVTVDGWMLAITEARLCALTYLVA